MANDGMVRSAEWNGLKLKMGARMVVTMAAMEWHSFCNGIGISISITITISITICNNSRKSGERMGQNHSLYKSTLNSFVN